MTKLNQKNRNFTLKELLFLAREEWSLLFKGMIFLALSSGAMLLYPQYIKVIVDKALRDQDSDALNSAAVIALVVLVIQAIASMLRYYYFTLAGEKTVARLRASLYSRLLLQEMNFFDFSKSGELLGRLTSDTAVLQNALSVNISMLLRNLVQALGGLVMILIISPKLTGLLLVMLPPLGFFAARFGKKVKSLSKEGQAALALSSAIAQEGLSGIRTVKAFAQENWEIARYQRMLLAAFKISLQKISLIARFGGLVTSFGFVIIVAIVWLGGNMVINNQMSLGTLTSYLLYVMTVAFSAGMLGGLYSDFMSALGAAQRLFELLNLKVVDRTATQDLAGQDTIGNAHIRFEQVAFSYPARKEFHVLKTIDLEILPKQTVAIVGTSGSGKSTLAQLLLRFYDPDTGNISIDGINLKNKNIYQLRKEIGLVAQEPILISESIADNIRYANPDAGLDQVINSAKLAYAHEFIMGFPQGYNTLVGEKGVQLSGGQKQRVAIARAILKNPKILILDEATSALDSESEHLVQQALDNLMQEKTTLIIAHRLSTVKKAHKIFVMENGCMVEAGRHDELIQRAEGYYAKLIQKQFQP